jgi:predicted transcriptional regulator of viral defense system
MALQSAFHMRRETFYVHLCISPCNSRHHTYHLVSSPYAKLAAEGPFLHTKQHQDPESLAKLVDEFQASGRYTFTRDEAIASLGATDAALTKAVQRLIAKNRLAAPRRGFYIIVPIEYRRAGAPPPDWYIRDLMAYSHQPYYVGLLSAAALHGAAHHQPQEFQVITDRQLRAVEAGRGRTRFFKKLGMESTPILDVNTETGLMRVSTPEATALDLLRYRAAAGHIGHVVTVLAELAEKMDPVRTVEAAKLDDNLPNAQRLGYLLDLVGASEMSSELAAWVAERGHRYVALRPDRPSEAASKDSRWRLLINDKIEVEP